MTRCCHFWHAAQDCVVPYVNHILHRDRFSAISIASSSVRLWDLRSCCMVGAQPCDAGASSRSPLVLWRESWQDPLGICVVVHTRNVPQKGLATWLDYWTVSLGCPVSLRTSLFRTNWYHLIPSRICRHHWSKADLPCICPRDCPAVWPIQEDKTECTCCLFAWDLTALSTQIGYIAP